METQDSTNTATSTNAVETATGVPQEQTASTFLNLPAEIRNRIYYAAAGEPTYLNASKPQTYTHHGLLAVNQQIRKEFLSIYYTTHGVEVEVTNGRGGTEEAQKWLQVFAPIAFPWLHKFGISLHFPCGCTGGMMKHSIYLTFGHPEYTEYTPMMEQHLLPRGLYGSEFRICGHLMNCKDFTTAFIWERMEGREEVRFTRQDFEAFVGEVGRLIGYPMRRFPFSHHMVEVEDFDLAEFLEKVETQLEGH